MAVKKKEKGNGAAYFFDALFSLALLAGIGYGGYYLITHGNVVEQKETYVQNTAVEETTEEATELSMIYDMKEVSQQDLHQGNLILVNRDLSFQGGEENLVSLYDVILEKECHSFGTKDGDLKISQECAEALVNMMNAFCEETSDNNVVVQIGYRTEERQQELFDDGATDIPAGYSEHHTGLAVNMIVSDGGDSTNFYSWINEHGAEYGFILRYPENKTGVTNIEYEPDHFRYVGKPHAQYIQQMGLCLEEYIMLLRGYDYESQHLMITDEKSSEIYEVYYYPADTLAEKTMLPVPPDKTYTISGNNQDGFIVTVDTGEIEVPEEETAPEIEGEVIEESSNP